MYNLADKYSIRPGFEPTQYLRVSSYNRIEWAIGAGQVRGVGHI